MLPFLTTTRTHLRCLTQADLPDLFALNHDPLVMKYVGRQPVKSLGEAQLDLTRYLSYYHKSPHLGVWACVDKESGVLIGLALLKTLVTTEETEVGYRFHQAYWGRGIATEVCRALIEHGFQTAGLQRIVGITHPDNIASQRVLQKCGLRFEKVWPYQHLKVNMYAIHKDSFAQ